MKTILIISAMLIFGLSVKAPAQRDIQCPPDRPNKHCEEPRCTMGIDGKIHCTEPACWCD